MEKDETFLEIRNINDFFIKARENDILFLGSKSFFIEKIDYSTDCVYLSDIYTSSQEDNYCYCYTFLDVQQAIDTCEYNAFVVKEKGEISKEKATALTLLALRKANERVLSAVQTVIEFQRREQEKAIKKAEELALKNKK